MKLLSAVLVLLSIHTAEAKEATQITAARQLLDAQVAAITARDAKAFAAAFDAPAYLIFPTALEAGTRTKIETAARTWLDGLGKITAKSDHVRIGKIADTGSAWISAEIVATGGATVRWRVTEIVAPLQSIVEQPTVADYRVLAAEISEPMDDKASLTAKLPALPEIEGGKAPTADEPVAPNAMSRLAIADDAAVTFIGSAPKELLAGKSAFAGMVKAWKGLEMKPLADLGVSDSNSMAAAGATIWHVQVTYKVGGKPIVVPYRAMLIYAGPAPAVHRPYTLVAAHFSIAQR